MILKVHSDESYLSVPNSRSRAAGHFYFGNQLELTEEEPTQGAVYAECSIIKPVVASASEALIAALFINAQKALVIRRTAQELGHVQPPTPIRCDNTTADDFTNSNMVNKKSKSIDMRWWWLRDKEREKQLHIYWQPGTENLADYYSKHHYGIVHRMVRPKHLHLP